MFDFLNNQFANKIRAMLQVSPAEFQKQITAYKSFFEVSFDSKQLTNNEIVVREGNFIYTNPHSQIEGRAYLYLPNYKVKEYKKFPKYHLYNCETAQKYAGYVYSNADLVDIRCSNTGEKYKDKKLAPCQNCADIFKEKTAQSLYGKSFQQAILDIAEKETEENKQRSAANGYAINWGEISSAYRHTKAYKCESCAIQMTEKTHQHYIETHHKDGNKMNNKTANFQSLCVLCHASVDARHEINYSIKENSAKVKNFIDLFENQSSACNTEKLNHWKTKLNQLLSI